MQRKFITNLALLLFLNLLVKPFWILGIDREVQNVVGTENYGFYYSILNFSFLLNILLDLGITNFNNRNIAQHSHLVAKHFSVIAALRVVLGIIYLAATIVIGIIIGYDATQLWFLLILGFNQFLLSFILYQRSNLAGLHLFRLDSIVSVLDRVIMIVVCGALLWGNITEKTFQIEWFVYIQSLAYLLTGLIAFILVFRKVGAFRLNWNPAFFLVILKKSFPYSMLVLLMTFYYRVDGVMLERILPDGKTQAGIYAQAFRLFDAATMIGFLFASLLLPIFSRMIKQKQTVEPLVSTSFRLLFIPSVILAVGAGYYSEELMHLMYQQHVSASALLLQLLMISFLGVVNVYIFGTLLTADGSLKKLNWLAGGGMVLNIGLNFLLIPKYFVLGAAAASLVTQMLVAIGHIIMAQYIFKFRVNWKLIFKLIVFITGVLGIAAFSKTMNFSWAVSLALFITSSFLWAILLNILNVKAFYSILKEKE